LTRTQTIPDWGTTRRQLMTSNPYEPPKSASSIPAQFLRQSTRWGAVRAGLWRGARIGFVTVAVVMFVAMGVAGVVALFGHSLAGWQLPSDLQSTTWLDVVKGLGSFVFGVCLFGFLYGAIPGAVILGVVAAVRWRPTESRPQREIS
jgi:hypothetical protein